MPPETEQRLSNVEHALQLVRDQVDELHVAAGEKKKPWYRQTPSLISVLALLASVATAVYSGFQGKQQDLRQKQDSLRAIVSALIDLTFEQQSKLGSEVAQKLSNQEREFISGMLNNKRMLLAEAADNLVRQIPQDVSSSEYYFLANDKQANGGAARAEEYLKKAVTVSQEPLVKMIALRNLGYFYALRGPLQSISEARKKFQEAVDLIPGEPRDDATAYTLGFTWETWGTAEFMNNFPDEGRQKMGNARKYYEDLSKDNTTRNWALKFLDSRLRTFTAANPSTPAPVFAAPTPEGQVALPTAASPSPTLPPPPTPPIPAQSPGMTHPRNA
jgi:type II secretory pathway pseudopilin PulG